MSDRRQTFGEYRIGVDFNPSKETGVTRIKAASAALIDLIEAELQSKLKDPETDLNVAEMFRLKALATTGIEEAAMWAVKCLTKPPR